MGKLYGMWMIPYESCPGFWHCEGLFSYEKVSHIHKVMFEESINGLWFAATWMDLHGITVDE